MKLPNTVEEFAEFYPVSVYKSDTKRYTHNSLGEVIGALNHREVTSQENISLRLMREKKKYLKMLKHAFDSRMFITEEQFNKKEIPQTNRSSVCYLPEEHANLYPWLLTEAYKMAGLEGDELEATVLRQTKHEYEHAAALPPGVKTYLGVTFMQMSHFNGDVSLGVKPIHTRVGSVTVAQQKDITSAPEELSPGDVDKLASLGKGGE